MKLQVKSRKANANAKANAKTNTKGKKTSKNNSKKSRKSTRRMEFRVGMKELGEIVMKIVKNKKKLDLEEKKEEHAQSPYRQDLDEEKETLKNELRTALKDDKDKISEILEFVSEYIRKESSMNAELKYNLSSGDAQGDSWDTTEYYNFLLMLEKDYDINTDPTPSTPRKPKRTRSDGDEEGDGNEEPYKHVFDIGR